jgi:hypothetical protein
LSAGDLLRKEVAYNNYLKGKINYGLDLNTQKIINFSNKYEIRVISI